MKITNGNDRLRIGLQKSGRLAEKSMTLLQNAGLNFEASKDRLFSRCENFPVDLMLLRDDDIPEYVSDGVCDLGIVGYNVLQEKLLARWGNVPDSILILKKLGFGRCRLSLALPNEKEYQNFETFSGMRIATSYPATLGQFLAEHKIDAKVVEISGSVEIAPTLDIADAICDLVSTGSTLKSNGLREVVPILDSESVLVQTRRALSLTKAESTMRLLQRIEGVLKAQQTKYIMMNAPREALPKIRDLIPGMEEPTVVPLGGGDRVAIHAVASENIFWETMEKLKGVGASSILVVPIEKIIQ